MPNNPKRPRPGTHTTRAYAETIYTGTSTATPKLPNEAGSVSVQKMVVGIKEQRE
jgi:hypothetical protein